jgi:hypothetical protein
MELNSLLLQLHVMATKCTRLQLRLPPEDQAAISGCNYDCVLKTKLAYQAICFNLSSSCPAKGGKGALLWS